MNFSRILFNSKVTYRKSNRSTCDERRNVRGAFLTEIWCVFLGAHGTPRFRPHSGSVAGSDQGQPLTENLRSLRGRSRGARVHQA